MELSYSVCLGVGLTGPPLLLPSPLTSQRPCRETGGGIGGRPLEGRNGNLEIGLLEQILSVVFLLNMYLPKTSFVFEVAAVVYSAFDLLSLKLLHL